MNLKWVKVELCFFQKSKKQKIIVTSYFPLLNGLIYKPIKHIIKKGSIFSNLHKNNKSPSKSNVERRKKKDIFLLEHCNHTNNEYILRDDTEIQGNGIVSLISKFTGGTSNREAKFFIQNTENKLFVGLNIAKLFQDPKNLPKGLKSHFDVGQKNIIEFDEFIAENEDYATTLLEYYSDNIKTCTSHEPMITSNKNGQSKNVIKRELVDLQEIGIQNDGLILNYFRKGLDKRFSFTRDTRECYVCKLNHPNMLVASHIKARAESKDNINEKIDPNNGFWLCAQHDRAFDRRLISFDNNGKVLISKELAKENIINIDFTIDSKSFNESKSYLEYHLNKFKEKFNIST